MLLHTCFSSAEVAFPEFTVCPDYNGMTYDWDTLCVTYNLCYAKSFQNGNIFPNDTKLSEQSISDYFKSISHSLKDLVSKVEITTTNNNIITNET